MKATIKGIDKRKSFTQSTLYKHVQAYIDQEGELYMSDENMKDSIIDAAFTKKNEEEVEEKVEIGEENKAMLGDVVTFQRDGKDLKGVVTSDKLENSVVVDMTIMEDFKEKELDFEKTVVRHGKYTIQERAEENQ